MWYIPLVSSRRVKLPNSLNKCKFLPIPNTVLLIIMIIPSEAPSLDKPSRRSKFNFQISESEKLKKLSVTS